MNFAQSDTLLFQVEYVCITFKLGRYRELITKPTILNITFFNGQNLPVLANIYVLVIRF